MHTPTHKMTLNLTVCNTLCCQLSIYFITSSWFPGGSDGQESACNVGDLGWISGLGKLLRRVWQLTPVFLDNPVDREAWWPTVPRVAKSWT